jgi:bifunctional non-homologous end joining protein LigD
MATKPMQAMREIPSQTSLFEMLPESELASRPHPISESLTSFEETSKNNLEAANCRRYGMKEHLASQHHYDFRLGYENVLLSWVLPYGLSTRIGERRIAIRVADHDREYLTSERVIPVGMYGAGPVLLYDEGFWIALPGYEDIPGCLRSGRLKFRLKSHKLNAVWILQRRRANSIEQFGNIWDLIRESDEFASDENVPDILITARRSVLSGRTLEELMRDGNKKPVKRAPMPLPFENRFQIS